MKQKILRELATWSFDLLVFAMKNDGCNNLNELVAKIAYRYPFADDLRHLRADYEYCMESSNQQ